MSALLDSVPAQDGFCMPGEHEPQDEIWMAWPERPDNWRNGGKPAQQAFVNVAEAISAVTPVTMVVSAGQYVNARNRLSKRIRVIEMTADDAWMRDIGPSYVVDNNGERRGVDWQFNAWGGLVDGTYFPWNRDDQVAGKVCEIRGDARYRAPIVLEGGSIHVDGDGTLYTTEECLLHPGRNPNLTREEIERVLKDYLDIEKVIWIRNGLYNDETNGHVDNLIHIPRPGEVILSWCDDEHDPQYKLSRDAYRVLSTERDARGRQIKIHKITIPGPLYITEEEAAGIDSSDGMKREAGERLAGSYANFLISNNRVIFPLLDPHTDDDAKQVLKGVFPGHEVVGIEAREVLLGGGNIHCITQQVPAPRYHSRGEIHSC